MKKSVFKKLLSIALVLSMLAAIALPASAAKDIKDIEITCPIVSVPGFMSSEIYRNPGTPEKEMLWPPSGDLITSEIEAALPAIAEFAVTHNWDKFGDVLIERAMNILGNACCDGAGNPEPNTGVDWSYPENPDPKGWNEFKYDWRLDPIVIASQLKDFIDYVREKTGAEEICLDCHSMGGVVVTTYLAQYGYEGIRGISMDTTAVFGETYTGELMLGKLEIDSMAVYDYILYAIQGSENEASLKKLMTALLAAGVFDVAEGLGDSLAENLGERAFKEVLLPVFGGWLGIWAMIPDEFVEEAVELSVSRWNMQDEYAELFVKRDYYNANVRAKRNEILNFFNENRRLCVISRYGFCSIPATPSWRNLSDGTIDTKFSTFGATTSLYDETLSNEYLASLSTQKYVSPDKKVDASTCMFPDKTWIIKDMRHADGIDNIDELKEAVFFANETVTIDTYEEFPQYLINHGGNADPFTKYDASIGFFEKLARFLDELRRKIEMFFRTINIFKK